MLAPLCRSLWALLREQRCVVCGTPVQRGGQNGLVLCPRCAPALERRTGGFCPRCGDIMGWPDQQPALCGHCLVADPPWRRFFFHGVYEGLLRELLLRLKNRHELALAHCLGLALSQHPGLEPGYDALVPAPMHAQRLRTRGFNQAQEIARPLAAALAVPLAPQLLTRPVAARPQTGLSHAERRHNLQGVFAAAREAQGLKLLLVDDVATTCATLERATTALLEAGAAVVDVMVLARTPSRLDHAR